MSGSGFANYETLWLEQFNRKAGDRALAEKLLREIRFVSNTDLYSDIELLLTQKFPGKEGVALYVERELRTFSSGKVEKMYKELSVRIAGRKRKITRADGAAIAAVKSPRYNKQEIGSEGVVAQCLTKICKKHRQFFLQPSTNEIRRKRAGRPRIRHLVVVTDLIASGDRILKMLDSLWQLRTVLSWHSLKLVRLHVLCYSATDIGMQNVRKHTSQALVEQVVACPTVKSSFSVRSAKQIIDLCERYGDFHKEPLGYKDVASLIAFEHGCPNNAPAIFVRESTKRKNPWSPLFESFETMNLSRKRVAADPTEANLVLDTLQYHLITISEKYLCSSVEERNMVLLLAAISRKHRTVPAIIAITRLALWEIRDAVSRASSLNLMLEESLSLTAVGRRYLERLTIGNDTNNSSANIYTNELMYYPKALRAPK